MSERDAKTVRIDYLEERIHKIEENQEKILQEFSKYKGWVGGIIFTASALTAAVGVVYQWIKIKAGL